MLFGFQAQAHEMTPAYPKFNYSYIEGVSVAKMFLFNSIKDHIESDVVQSPLSLHYAASLRLAKERLSRIRQIKPSNLHGASLDDGEMQKPYRTLELSLDERIIRAQETEKQIRRETEASLKERFKTIFTITKGKPDGNGKWEFKYRGKDNIIHDKIFDYNTASKFYDYLIAGEVLSPDGEPIIWKARDVEGSEAFEEKTGYSPTLAEMELATEFFFMRSVADVIPKINALVEGQVAHIKKKADLEHAEVWAEPAERALEVAIDALGDTWSPTEIAELSEKLEEEFLEQP